MAEAPPRLDKRGLPPGYPFRPDLETTPRQVKALLDQSPPGVLLIDCRTADEARIAAIPGSRLVPLTEIEARADELAAAAEEAGVPIAVHCHHGMRSLKATLALRAKGVTDVRSVAGGIDLWSLVVDSRIPRY